MIFLFFRDDQYETKVLGNNLMMLPTDMALVSDPEFKKWVEIYAADKVSPVSLDLVDAALFSSRVFLSNREGVRQRLLFLSAREADHNVWALEF